MRSWLGGWKAGLKASTWWGLSSAQTEHHHYQQQGPGWKPGRALTVTLVIHAAALGIGQHVHEAVHLGCRALCVEPRPWGAQTAQLGPPAHPATPHSHPQEACWYLPPTRGHLCPQSPAHFLQDSCPQAPRWPLAPFMPATHITATSAHPAAHSHGCQRLGPAPPASSAAPPSGRPARWLNRLKKPSWSGSQPGEQICSVQPASARRPVNAASQLPLGSQARLSFSAVLTMVPADVLLCRAAPNET